MGGRICTGQFWREGKGWKMFKQGFIRKQYPFYGVRNLIEKLLKVCVLTYFVYQEIIPVSKPNPLLPLWMLPSLLLTLPFPASPLQSLLAPRLSLRRLRCFCLRRLRRGVDTLR